MNEEQESTYEVTEGELVQDLLNALDNMDRAKFVEIANLMLDTNYTIETIEWAKGSFAEDDTI